MARLGAAGDTSRVKPDEMNQARRGLLILEEGWYRAALESDSLKDFDWGQGLNLNFKILDGHYRNYHIFDFLCLVHTKEKAERIARVRLRELAVAAGHRTPDNVHETDSIVGKPVMIRIYREEDDSKYAEEDGRRPRVAEYLGVTAWKEHPEKSQEPMPGVTTQVRRAEAPRPPAEVRSIGRATDATEPTRRSRPAQAAWPVADDDIPF